MSWLPWKIYLYRNRMQMCANLTADTEKCTICGQDVEYIRHLRVQHGIGEDIATALKALQRRIQLFRRENR